MMEKIKDLLILTRLEFGMLVSLLKNANLITYEFVIGLPFDKLAEICQTGADEWLREGLLQTMEKQATDFYEWKKIYEGDTYSQSQSRRKRALSEMARLAGADFEKLYDIWKLPRVGGCKLASDFLEIASKIEGRMCRDCSLTHEQALRLLNNEPRDSELGKKAYKWMMEFVKNEFNELSE